jgi:hypothetical protein
VSVEAAISALRQDSDRWDRVAGVTNRAGQEANILVLGESQLSWASVPTGLLSTYAEIQQKVAMLLGVATQVYGELSIALDKVANAYEVSDENAARHLKGVWDVRE